MSTLPAQARVVTIGVVVVGCSVAYHLARIGWTDVVLRKRKQLTCGKTWHAAGLIGQLRATANLTRLAKHSAELYGGLEAETGVEHNVVNDSAAPRRCVGVEFKEPAPGLTR